MAPIEILSAPLDPVRVLCFAPHPDDEVLGPGGTLLLHARSGGDVRVVLATDGAAGDPDRHFDPAVYPELRRAESRRAMELLGVSEPLFWGLPDSCEIAESDKLRVIELVREAVSDFAPEVVYLPWRQDNNRDHLVLHEVVVRGLRESKYAGDARGYEVWAPNPMPDLVVDISDVVQEKREALACYETQFAYGDLGHQVFGMNAYRSLLLEKTGAYGEAFQRIDL
jgi:LmbE family N-acetylglucosaminyl deacetylase